MSANGEKLTWKFLEFLSSYRQTLKAARTEHIPVSPLSCVSCVPTSCVHIWFVSCRYELICVQLCVCDYVLITLCILVLSFEFDFVWSTRYFPGVSCLWVLPCLALSYLDVALKTIIWVYVLVCVFLFLPLVCTVTIPGMWSARDKKEGKSDHAPSHTHKPRPHHLFFKNIYFSIF